MVKFTANTTLLINGIKGKINEQGSIIDNSTKDELIKFIEAFRKPMEN